MLAYLLLLEHEKAGGGDLTDAVDHVNTSIKEDVDYRPPHYLRAVLELKGNLIAKALRHAEEAVMVDGTACYDLQDPEEVRRWWSTVAGTNEFERIRGKCKVRWAIR